MLTIENISNSENKSFLFQFGWFDYILFGKPVCLSLTQCQSCFSRMLFLLSLSLLRSYSLLPLSRLHSRGLEQHGSGWSLRSGRHSRKLGTSSKLWLGGQIVGNRQMYLWRRKWQPTPVFLPGKSHEQRILAGYSPCGHKKSDMTENTCIWIR